MKVFRNKYKGHMDKTRGVESGEGGGDGGREVREVGGGGKGRQL